MSTYLDPATALRIARESRAAQLRDAETSRLLRGRRNEKEPTTTERPSTPRRRPLVGWRVRPA